VEVTLVAYFMQNAENKHIAKFYRVFVAFYF